MKMTIETIEDIKKEEFYDTPSKVVCRECGKPFSYITPTHLKSHNLLVSEYKNKYPKAPLVSEETIVKTNYTKKNKTSDFLFVEKDKEQVEEAIKEDFDHNSELDIINVAEKEKNVSIITSIEKKLNILEEIEKSPIIDKNTNKIIDAMSSGPVIEELNDIITTVKEMINEPPKKFIDKFKSVDEEKIKILNWLISRFDDVQNSFFIEKYNDQKLLVYKLVTDIAIPIRKIDIEFPNAFWHNFDEPKLTRDKKLKEDGWIIIDVNSKMPKIEDLEKELKKYNLFWI